jgi:hypothetical protein
MGGWFGRALALGTDATKFLSAVQLGITPIRALTFRSYARFAFDGVACRTRIVARPPDILRSRNGQSSLPSRSATRTKVLTSLKIKPEVGAKEMGRISVAFLIATGLMLNRLLRSGGLASL